jgi:hypothetical protein
MSLEARLPPYWQVRRKARAKAKAILDMERRDTAAPRL